jgi:DNA-binding SARP family transcriptional activator/predicted ATPase
MGVRQGRWRIPSIRLTSSIGIDRGGTVPASWRHREAESWCVMPRLSISLLGTLQVRLGARPVTAFEANSARALLAYLACHAGMACQRDALAGLLWPDYPNADALRNLRKALYRVRKALSMGEPTPPYLLAARHTIQLNPAVDCRLDVAAFDAALAAARTHPHHRLERCPACAAHLAEAAALYRGEFMAGMALDSVPFEEWLDVQRTSYHRDVLQALSALASYCERLGDYDRALCYARRQVELEPWREGAHRQLMRALAFSGQREAALAQFQACASVLRDELGVAPAGETVALYEAIRDGARLPALYPPLPNNLPASTTRFVGREELLAKLARLLQDGDCRLITLVGPGGSGKTRLALQAGAEVVAASSERFPDGVYLVPLATLQAGDSVGPSIAQALGYSLEPGQDPAGQLLRALRRKRLLLILDNYEQLLDGSRAGRLVGAGAVAEILAAAPGAQILVTSRARLNVLAEHVLPVGGMAFPATDREDGEELTRHSAVALFLDRARAVRPTFAFGGVALGQVGRICRLVEGMPLAILLCASWIDVLSAGAIADRVAANLDLLEAELEDLPVRQRSMRAVFDASWATLTEEARSAFARMSVFGAGCTQEAARAVAGAGLHTLRELVCTSFLQRTEVGRYEIHELLRQYGEGKLSAAPGERERTLDRHCAYYADFYTERVSTVARGDIGPVASEVDNIRAAWHWALDAARVDRVRQFVGRLQEGILELEYVALGGFSGDEEAFAQAVSVLRAAGESVEDTIALGVALRCQALHAYTAGHVDRSASLLRKCMPILQRCDAKAELSIAKVDAYAAGVGKTAAGGEQLLREALALAREARYEAGVAYASGKLAGLALHRRSFQEAEQYVRDALAVVRRKECILDRWYMVEILATIAYARGDYAGARRYVLERMAIADQVQWPMAMATAQTDLGAVMIALGKPEEAHGPFRRAFEIAQRVGDGRMLAFAQCSLGDGALADGDVHQARVCYRQALALAAEEPWPMRTWRAMRSMAALRAREGRLERAVALLVLALDPTWAWSFEYGVALRLMIELESQLPPSVCAAAKERGRSMSLPATVLELLEELKE